MPDRKAERMSGVLERCAAQRAEMVRTQIMARGLRDSKVIAALHAVPRELFVPAELVGRAYEDSALPLGPGQTISQPYIVAFMTHHLACWPGARVLEVGAGSGYQACVLAQLVAEVHTVELDATLAEGAARRAASLGCTNIQVHVGDGGQGWPAKAPYDRIIVTAACPECPAPLVDQLAVGGIALMPIGPDQTQTLTKVVRNVDGVRVQRLIDCRFVKLLGKYGQVE